jgi:hypothetical protein
MLGKKIDALDYLGINRLYEHNTLHQNHPVIRDIFDKCKQNVYSLKLALGIDLSKVEKPIQCIQNILGLLGHKMPYLKREGSGRKGNQVRVYGKPAADFEKEEVELPNVIGAKKLKLKLDDSGLPIPKKDGREEVYSEWLERDLREEEKLIKARQEHEKWCNTEMIQQIADDLQSAADSRDMLSDIITIYPYTPALIKAIKTLPANTQVKINNFYGLAA